MSFTVYINTYINIVRLIFHYPSFYGPEWASLAVFSTISMGLVVYYYDQEQERFSYCVALSTNMSKSWMPMALSCLTSAGT